MTSPWIKTIETLNQSGKQCKWILRVPSMAHCQMKAGMLKYFMLYFLLKSRKAAKEICGGVIKHSHRVLKKSQSGTGILTQAQTWLDCFWSDIFMPTFRTWYICLFLIRFMKKTKILIWFWVCPAIHFEKQNNPIIVIISKIHGLDETFFHYISPICTFYAQYMVSI